VGGGRRHAARGREAGEQIARDLGMRPFQIATKAKPIYHAGAVFASNYLVVVEAVAQRLLRHAGLSDAPWCAAIRRRSIATCGCWRWTTRSSTAR
jgi:predicted short-subunit dehydrogenase-like oxidoreductase (DUF2520 family)